MYDYRRGKENGDHEIIKKRDFQPDIIISFLLNQFLEKANTGNPQDETISTFQTRHTIVLP